MAVFKDELSIGTIEQLGSELTRAWDDFPTDHWVTLATNELEDLELLERVNHLAEVLALCLPNEFPDGAAVLAEALGSESFTGWMTLPCGKYVADTGIDHPHVALPLLAGLTPRFSSEFPIRFFIEAHPDITFQYLHEWTAHSDEHVRRLVSEGTRPRLPWASRLRGLMEDPSPAVELLEKLFDDESEYVRRS
ncbi:MAG: DNA alkylation repair protein, partial [Acidimicrobiia bacterium]